MNDHDAPTRADEADDAMLSRPRRALGSLALLVVGAFAAWAVRSPE